MSHQTGAVPEQVTHYDLSQVGLKLLVQSTLIHTINSLDRKAGHDRVLLALTDLAGHIVLIGLDHSKAELEGTQSNSMDYFGVIRKPKGLVEVLKGLDKHGASVLGFDEVGF